MPSNITLLVGGKLYGGWEDVSVTRAIDAASGAFDLTVTERWAGNRETPWPISPGDACEIRADDELLITGYVDIFAPSFDASTHRINIQGRDKTADLIDCSAVHSPDEWRKFTVLDLARTLCAPFGVAVSVSPGVDIGAAFPVCKIQQGESVFEALDRHCRLRKLLLTADGSGGLLITTVGIERATSALVQGQNILAATGSIDASERFSEYTVKAQAAYSEDSTGETEAHITGSVQDSAIKRYRPLLVIAEGGGSSKTATDRAVWECNTRIGRAAQAALIVQGWRQKSGALWKPNLLVAVQSDWLRMSGDMLIRQVTFQQTLGSGTTATIDLVSPLTYLPEPIDPERADGQKKKKHGGSGINWEEVING